MEEKIEVGDTVKLKSDVRANPQLMTVFSIEGENSNLRWFDQHQFLQKETMPTVCLLKIAVV